MSVIRFWLSHRVEFLAMLGQHIVLVLIATTIAIAAGIPLGIVAARRPRLGASIVAVTNIVQTIPSLALFGFLIPLPFIGLGGRAAVTALTLYGLLPVVRGTIAGLRGIDAAVREAGVAMGMTPRQLLQLVELPLAAPSIVAGIRVATVIGVGTATIAAAIGAGGLGDYIFRGLSMVDPTVILAGAIPTAALALIADGSLGVMERRLARRGRFSLRGAARLGTAVILVAIAAAWVAGRERGTIRIGSKNFTEQVILGELMAQTIERYAGLSVDRRLNLGGTFICDRALRAGDIDGYIEYTGTALTAIFHQPVVRSAGDALGRVRESYARTAVTTGRPLGFNNTFAILVRGRSARDLGLRTIADAARHSAGWRAGFGYEFLEREDGFKGLARTYGLQFAVPPRVMDLTLIYRALAEGHVDLIAGDATNGLIAGLDLAMLEDNLSYFPPYEAVPLMRSQTLLGHPEIRAALDRLSGRITARDMRAMNYAVDVGRRDAADVAREFLGRLDSSDTH